MLIKCSVDLTKTNSINQLSFKVLKGQITMYSRLNDSTLLRAFQTNKIYIKKFTICVRKSII